MISRGFHSGRVVRGLPFSLARHNDVTIGTERSCDIVVEAEAPHHAELHWDESASAWRVCADPTRGETLVNGVPAKSTFLHDGDWVEVAGVRIGYSEGMLRECDPSAPVGLRVTLRQVFATTDKGKRLLDNISFQVAEGAFAALLGPSGGGKSTLIQRIAGLAPFEGSIRLNGHEVQTEKKQLLPLVAYLPQAVENTLHENMTVREVMRDFAQCHLAVEAVPDFRAKLEEVGLGDRDFPDKKVDDLSGGQKRRLALALALMRNPQLLLLDEPTAGLDPAAEAGIMELLRGIANNGRTVLCATHVLGSLGLCDEVAVLDRKGRLAFHGAPDDALSYFRARDWLGVYKALYAGDGCPGDGDAPEDSQPRALPSASSSASFGRTFRAIFMRLADATVAKRSNALLFFGNPLGIAAVLLLACWSIFDNGTLGTIYFCMAVAMFWTGLSGAVRNLVSERVPKRCLDRMRGMPLPRYFFAHVAFAAASSGVQSLLFLLPVFLLKLGHAPFTLRALPSFWFILFLVGFSGSCVGLFASALAKKELHAVWSLPIIAVFALFLGKPVLEGGNGEEPTGPLRVVERAMPTFHPQTVLETEMDAQRYRSGRFGMSADGWKKHQDDNRNNWLWFFCVAAGYPIVFLSLAVLFQNYRERQWNGR